MAQNKRRRSMLVNEPSDKWGGCAPLPVGQLAVKSIHQNSLVYIGWPGKRGQREWHPCRIGTVDQNSGRTTTIYLSRGTHIETGESGDYDFPPERYGRDWLHEQELHEVVVTATNGKQPSVQFEHKDVKLLMDFSQAACEQRKRLDLQELLPELLLEIWARSGQDPICSSLARVANGKVINQSVMQPPAAKGFVCI